MIHWLFPAQGYLDLLHCDIETPGFETGNDEQRQPRCRTPSPDTVLVDSMNIYRLPSILVQSLSLFPVQAGGDALENANKKED